MTCINPVYSFTHSLFRYFCDIKCGTTCSIFVAHEVCETCLSCYAFPSVLMNHYTLCQISFLCHRYRRFDLYWPSHPAKDCCWLCGFHDNQPAPKPRHLRHHGNHRQSAGATVQHPHPTDCRPTHDAAGRRVDSAACVIWGIATYQL